jgi:hypothetical protein
MIEGVIPFLQRISTPALLSTILQSAQLIAFLTYNYSSKSNFLIPDKASSIDIFCRPETVLRRSPNNRVAYLRMLTTLQCK